MSEPASKPPARMTVAQFLAWDDGTDTRHELLNGEIRAMAPPSPWHSLISANVVVALHSRLRQPCRVYSELGIRPPNRDDSYFQADIAVVCGELRQGEPLPDPSVIVEILSPSTLNHDRGGKAPEYRLLPGCGTILLIHSERRYVERWTRDGARWIVWDHIGQSGPVPIENLGIAVDLGEIYEGTGL